MPQRCYSALEGLEVLKEAEFLVVLMKSVSVEQRLQVAFIQAGRCQSLKRMILMW